MGGVGLVGVPVEGLAEGAQRGAVGAVVGLLLERVVVVGHAHDHTGRRHAQARVARMQVTQDRECPERRRLGRVDAAGGDEAAEREGLEGDDRQVGAGSLGAQPVRERGGVAGFVEVRQGFSRRHADAPADGLRKPLREGEGGRPNVGRHEQQRGQAFLRGVVERRLPVGPGGGKLGADAEPSVLRRRQPARPWGGRGRRRRGPAGGGVGGIGKDDAEAALEAAGGDIRAAIVMVKTGCGPEACRAALDEHGGRLREAVGALRSGGRRCT